MTIKTTRRSLLKGLGAAGAGLLASRYLPPLQGRARAAGGGGPDMNTVIFQMEHAFVADRFRMKPMDAPASFGQYAGNDPSWDSKPDPDVYTMDMTAIPEEKWSDQLKPFFPLAADIQVFDGMANLSATIATMKQWGGLHGRNNAGITTASQPAREFGDGAIYPSAMSIDQVIRKDIQKRFPGLGGLDSVQYRAQGHYTPNPDYDWCWTEDAGGQIIVRQPQLFADQAFDALFPTPPMPGMGPDPAAIARGKVLDLVQKQYNDLRPKLTRVDQERLQTHADLIADVIRRLGEPLASGCQPGKKPASRISGSYSQILDGMIDQHMLNIVAALSCGRTHVATLQIDWAKGDAFGYPEYDEGALHNELGHFDDPINKNGDYARCVEVLSAYNVWHMKKIANFCLMLKAIKDDSGASLLDSTQVVVMHQLAMGAHWPWNYSGMIIGGAKKYKTGVYRRFGRTVEAPWGPQGPDYWSSVSTEQWGNTIMRAAGVTAEHNNMPEKVGKIPAWGVIPDVLKA